MPCNDCRFDRKKKDFSSFLERTQLMKNNELLVYRSLLNFLCCCLVTKSCPTLAPPWTVAHQASLSMDFPRQDYRVSCHFLLQEIFPTQGSNPHLLHWQADSLLLSHQGSPIKCSPSFLEKYLAVYYFRSTFW